MIFLVGSGIVVRIASRLKSAMLRAVGACITSSTHQTTSSLRCLEDPRLTRRDYNRERQLTTSGKASGKGRYYTATGKKWFTNDETRARSRQHKLDVILSHRKLRLIDNKDTTVMKNNHTHTHARTHTHTHGLVTIPYA